MLRNIVCSSRGRYIKNFISWNYFTSFSNKSSFNKRSEEIFSTNGRLLTIHPNDEISPNELTEKSKVEGWKDTFGSLTGYNERRSLDEISEEEREGEIEDHIRLDAKYRKHEPDWYGMKIENLGKKGMIYEAVQVLEKEMLIDDRVKPNRFVYNNLIGVLGRVGHTEKAFKLFNDMKKRAIIPEDATYTSLFNSCSNAASKEDGLTRAIKLRALMKEKGITVNIITYQAMIKAFAHLGDVKTAFELADEAIENRLRLSAETYSFLMMACISDTDAGFSLCVKLWRKMRSKKISFDVFHYNLLLRCTRDCGVGNDATFKELLALPSSEDGGFMIKRKSSSAKQLPQSNYTRVDKNHIQAINSGEEENVISEDDHSSNNLEVLPNDRNLVFPNLLNPTFRMSHYSDWEIELPKDSSDRLIILSGPSGILNHMKKDNCKPDIKTFSVLLEMVAPADENDLLKAMEMHNVKPDLTLLNSLIKKRCLRRHYRDAKNVLYLMSELKLEPDEKTFGCLAMGCYDEKNGMALLNDMLKVNKIPNVEVCDNLIYLSKMNFRYKMKVFKFMKDHKIRPNLKLLQKLEKHVQQAKKKILDLERGKDVNPYFGSEEFKRQFELFMMNYKQWLYAMELEPEIDPATRYSQPTPQEELEDSKSIF